MENKIKAIINKTEKTIELQVEESEKALKEGKVEKYNYFQGLAQANQTRIEELKELINA